MKKRTTSYSLKELNNMVEQFRATQEHRVHEYRLKKHTATEKKTTKTDWWDMPLTVCSCGSTKAPFLAANGRNCSELKRPNVVLANAYKDIKDATGKHIGKIQLGQKPGDNMITALGMNGEKSFKAGRCAEQHAANRLFNEADKIPASLIISDLLFSDALDARYPIVKPYCATCRCVFPQLRK